MIVTGLPIKSIEAKSNIDYDENLDPEERINSINQLNNILSNDDLKKKYDKETISKMEESLKLFKDLLTWIILNLNTGTERDSILKNGIGDGNFKYKKYLKPLLEGNRDYGNPYDALNRGRGVEAIPFNDISLEKFFGVNPNLDEIYIR